MKVVRVRGLKEYQVKGKPYRYHRASNTRMDPTLEGTALAAEVDRLDRLHAPLQPVKGTLQLLIIAYKQKSDHWKDLRARTRVDYERVFRWLGAAMDGQVSRVKPTTIVGLRDKAREQHGYKFANQVLVALKMVFAFGVEYGHASSNPVKDVTPVRRPKDLPEANRPWSPAEVVATLDALRYPLRAPTAVAAYLGVREGDILAMSKGAYKDGVLSFTTSKTRRTLELPAPEDLRAIIEASQRERAAYFKRMKRADDALTLFVSSRGKPWTMDGFKTSFGKARDAMLKAELIGEGLTFHGLRHTVATILADEGYEAAATKHLLGHGAETITEHYSRRAKRKKPLEDMTNTVQRIYREEATKVVRIDRNGNASV